MMEFVKEILTKNTEAETGKVDIDAVMNTINQEAPKYAVPKDQYNKQSDQLKSANKTLDELKANNADNTELQKQVDDWKGKYETATKDYAVRQALQEAGAKDIDYMIYKLGNVDLNKDGTISDLENKIKGLKEGNADWFKSNDPDQAPAQDPTPTNGWTPLDNGLEGGKPSNIDAALSSQLDAAFGIK